MGRKWWQHCDMDVRESRLSQNSPCGSHCFAENKRKKRSSFCSASLAHLSSWMKQATPSLFSIIMRLKITGKESTTTFPFFCLQESCKYLLAIHLCALFQHNFCSLVIQLRNLLIYISWSWRRIIENIDERWEEEMAGTHNERGWFKPDSNRREIRRETGKEEEEEYTTGQSGGRRLWRTERMAEDREGWRLSNL